jgi:hypothetical protein
LRQRADQTTGMNFTLTMLSQFSTLEVYSPYTFVQWMRFDTHGLIVCVFIDRV